MRFLHKMLIGFMVFTGLVSGSCQQKQDRNLVQFWNLTGMLAIPSKRCNLLKLVMLISSNLARLSYFQTSIQKKIVI